MLYAAMESPRSWFRSVHADIRWLAATTTTFESLKCDTLAEWLQMAKRQPKQTADAVKKLSMQEKAIRYAEALAVK